LYVPRAQRPALSRLLSLADEIGAGAARGLDHEVAHARLEWWRHEAARYASGQSQHPWLRDSNDAHQGATRIELQPLLQAAAIDLAQALQRPPGGERLRRAVFVEAARLLGAGPPSPTLDEALGALAALSWQGEQRPTANSAAANAAAANAVGEQALSAAVQRLGAALQPRLAPLLVWAAMAAQGSRPQRNSMRRAIADNIRAWRIARRAAAGRFTGR
jgi:hypothetical protein